MAHADLKLNIGDVLQLQYLDGEERLQVQVIGYLAGQSLIVTTPKMEGRVLMMREGQPFAVRILSGNRVVGFNTRVLRSHANPYPYMHLAYPEEMEQTVIRKAQRVTIKLHASVENDNPLFGFDKPQPATLKDMSTAGALLDANQMLAEPEDEVVLSVVVTLGEMEKLLELPCKVRNVRSERGEHGLEVFHHGLEFLVLPEADTLVVHGFVYEQIVKALSG